MSTLTTDLNQLSSVNSSINARHREVPPLRGIQGNNFSSSDINYRWELGANQRMNLAKSYLRLRFRLYKDTGAGGPQYLKVSDDVAPAQNFCANLFKSCEFKIGQQTVDRVSSNLTRIDVLRNRIRKSKSWMDSVGASTNFMACEFGKRQLDVCDPASVPGATEINNLSAVELGLNAGNVAVTVEATAAGDTLTFANARDIRSILRLGDTITLAGVEYTILVFNDATVAVVTNVAADVAATANFRIIRKEVSLNCDNKPKRSQTHECIWQPPLAIFEHNEGMPTGRYELTLSPQNVNDFKKRCVESLLDDRNPGGAGADYDLEIIDCNMYVYQYDSERVVNTTYYIDMDNIRAQRETLDAVTDQTKQFDVSPSTYALTMAFGDTRAPTTTQISEAKFKSPSSDELRSFFLSYGGVQQPSPDARLDLQNNAYQVLQVYNDTLMATGSYYDSGGSETVSEWIARGQYYTYIYERDGTDRSTRVNIKLVFGSDPNNTEVLLFDHYKSVATVQVENGIVTNVSVAEQ